MYELKICKKKSLPFSAVAEHQIDGLIKAQVDGLYHRITDQSWQSGGGFTYKKPFDCCYFKKNHAFVVIWFYQPRKPKVFYKIGIVDWLDIQDHTSRKSITEEMAKRISSEIITIPNNL